MSVTSRRQFLGRIGSGIGATALGVALAERIGWAEALALPRAERLRFGALDPLVDLLQETEADALVPLLVQKLRSGLPLQDLVAAAALANARAFGGTDYNGYHTLMALAPSLEMAAQMPPQQAALPVLKVVHRNARFLRAAGRNDRDSLEPIVPIEPPATAQATDLPARIRKLDVAASEQSLAALVASSERAAYEQLQSVVRDDVNVHRVVLAWRAHDLLRVAGEQHATTLLRQSVRFCIHEDGMRSKREGPATEIATLLPKLMEEHALERRERGTRRADDATSARWTDAFFGPDRVAAAQTAAGALSEGFDPEEVGAAIALAATRLLLHDPGRSKDESAEKPRGTVHGASVGVHASDAANAWRNIARVGGARDAFASLVTGAYHTAGQSQHVGAQPFDHDAQPCTLKTPDELLQRIDGAIRDKDQRAACAAARRFGELGHPPDALFAQLLGVAVSVDGALHAEKYFRTAQEEHAAARPAERPLYLVALTRVMASSSGFPAPGCEEARRLLTA